MDLKIRYKNIYTNKRKCRICGYTYDPSIGDKKRGISPGILFEDLPDNWRCPVCKYTKWQFIILKKES